MIPLFDADTGLLVLGGKVRSHGTGGGGVLPAPPLTPQPLRVSSRVKTSCTASRWCRHSPRSPKVSRMSPTPGCHGPQPRPHPTGVLSVPSHPVPDRGAHAGSGRRPPPGPGRHGLRGAPRPAAHRHLPRPRQLHRAPQGKGARGSLRGISTKLGPPVPITLVPAPSCHRFGDCPQRVGPRCPSQVLLLPPMCSGSSPLPTAFF